MTSDIIIGNATGPEAIQPNQESLTGSCFIVGMPIGEQDDVTTRGVRTLQGADLVVAPEEREAARLLKRFAIAKPLMGIGEEIVEDVTEGVLERLRNGQRVVILSDSVVVLSEPIRWLANRIRESGLEPRIIPGVDLATMALMMSGFPIERYYVAGYIPTRREERETFIRLLAEQPETTLFFASAARLTSTLAALAGGLQGRSVAILMKPTIPGEFVARGTIEELQQRLASKMLNGIATIVLGPIRPAVEEPADTPSDALKIDESDSGIQ